MSRIDNPDLNRLVRELNLVDGSGSEAEPGSPAAEAESWDADRPPPGAGAFRLADPGRRVVGSGEPLGRVLDTILERGGSDLHLVPEHRPVLRIDDRLTPLEGELLESGKIWSLLEPHLGDREKDQLERRGAADASLKLVGPDGRPRGRFRFNVHRQRGAIAANLRALPRSVPTLAELNLPRSLAELVQPRQGLVLVCGPTGAGKSSTLAALVGEINRRRASHVITIEEPIEYEHGHGRSIVEQIEIGVDSPSFAEALRASLRQDPDVVLVGEMRDLETISTALTAAETGHLILSTLHTSDVVQAIHRMVDVFPGSAQSQIRQQLALSLLAIVSQRLIPRRDGDGRVPAVEVLRATYPVRQHIRSAKLEKIYNEITLGQRRGMVSMESSLASLVRGRMIELEEARVRSTRPEELESLLTRTGR